MRCVGDVNSILGGTVDRYADRSQPEIASLSAHLSLFDSTVLRTGDTALNVVMSAFSPELHVSETVERLVNATKLALNAQEAALFLIDRYTVCCCLHLVLTWCTVADEGCCGVVDPSVSWCPTCTATARPRGVRSTLRRSKSLQLWPPSPSPTRRLTPACPPPPSPFWTSPLRPSQSCLCRCAPAEGPPRGPSRRRPTASPSRCWQLLIKAAAAAASPPTTSGCSQSSPLLSATSCRGFRYTPSPPLSTTLSILPVPLSLHSLQCVGLSPAG